MRADKACAEACHVSERQRGDQRTVHACPACGGNVECGMVNGDDSCWCAALPHVLPLTDNGDATCYCRACLEALISERSQRQAG